MVMGVAGEAGLTEFFFKFTGFLAFGILDFDL